MYTHMILLQKHILSAHRPLPYFLFNFHIAASFFISFFMDIRLFKEVKGWFLSEEDQGVCIQHCRQQVHRAAHHYFGGGGETEEGWYLAEKAWL